VIQLKQVGPDEQSDIRDHSDTARISLRSSGATDLILRSREAASRRMNGTSGASWFETALRASSP
jgi:hypothetical protein